MFIKSFFAEPAAVLRPRLIVSAAGRVLAALFIAAAGLMVSAQSAFAQLQQGASLRYHATLVNDPSLSVEDAFGKAPTDAMIVLKHVQSGGEPEIAGFTVKKADGTYFPVGHSSDLKAVRDGYKTLRLYTSKSGFIKSIRAQAIETTGSGKGNPKPNSEASSLGGTPRQLERDGKSYVEVTSTTINTSIINIGQYNLVLDLFANHGFVGGDEIEVRVSNGTNEETLFTMVTHFLDFGTDDDVYTINAKAGENRDYPLAQLPANSRGFGTLDYLLIGGKKTAPSFAVANEFSFPATTWGAQTDHIRGSGRNFLRVSDPKSTETARAVSGDDDDENVYYYVKDANDVVIRRPYNFYLIAGLPDDDVDDSIPTFEQRMWCGEDNCGSGNGIHGRIRVYAREIFGPDATRLELARPSSAERGTYFALRARKKIGPSNTADITVDIVGAVMAGEMEPRHFRVLDTDEEAKTGITITKKSGGGVGDSSVVYTVEVNTNGEIDVGDILRVDIPALTGANLSDGSNITINAKVHSTRSSGSRFNFPTGTTGVSKCLSYRIGQSRECVFATSHDSVEVNITAVNGAPGEYASINPSDTASLISYGEDPRDAILPLYVGAGEYGRNQSGNVNAVAMGAARVVLDVDATFGDVPHKAMQANGTVFEVGPPTSVTTTVGSGLILTVSPTPTHGHVVISDTIAAGGNREIRSVASGSTRQRIYLSDTGDKVSQLYEIFYIPSEVTPLSGGTSLTLNGELDLGPDEYQDEMAANNRTVNFRLHAVEAKAKAYALPPPSSRDQAFIRIRCEDSNACDVSLNCSNQTGNAWFGSLENRIPAQGTTVVTADIISQALAADGFVPSRHWGGPTNGRLSCQILARQGQSITTQVLLRAGDILTNNTHVNEAVPPRN